MDMDLRLLEIFCAVYEEGGFSKAGSRLHLTQPTISGHIKSLEEYFGTPLFDRLGRIIQPTAAGELLYEQSRFIQERKKSITERMSKFLNGLEGKLHIGASTIPGEYLLPPIIGRFHKAYPKVEISMAVSDTQSVLRDVERRRVELGFAGARLEDGDLQFEKFASDRLILVVPNNKTWAGINSISLKELLEVPLVVREPGSGTRAIFERKLLELRHTLGEFNIVAQLGSTAAIKQGVTANVGISITSSVAVQHETSCGLMKEVKIREIKSLERDFFIVRNRKRTPSPTCEALLEMVLGKKAG